MAIKRITTNLIKDSDIATVDIANNAITAAKITDGNITTAKLADLNVTAGKLAATLDLTGKTITVATATTGDSDTSPASTAFVQQEIAALVDSSPSSLNTLNELAAALGDDASFSTTVTNSIATKLPLAGGTMTGAVILGTAAAQGNQSAPALRFGPSTYRLGMYTDSEGAFIENKNGDDGINFLVKTAGQAMRIDGGTGNVGIGTINPQGTFVVSNSGAGGFEFTPDTTSLGVANTNYIASYDRSASAYRDIVIDLGGAESQAVRFKAGGNVGIGTSSPVAKLDIRMSDSNGTYGRGREGNLNLENTNTSVTEGGWLSISGYMGNTSNSGQYQMGFVSGGKQTTAADGDYGGYLTLWTTSSGANGEANSGAYERMRIDSAGNVGIGMNPSGYGKLSVNSTGVILALRASSGAGRLGFYEGGAGRFYLDTLNGSDGLAFVDADGSSERMRIDSSGNLLVGTTDDVVWNNSANSSADNGHNLRDDGRAGFSYYNATANANATVNINRTGSDGDLIRLFKSGSTVGSIGAYNGVPYIGYAGGAGGGIMFNGASIEPTALGSSRTSGANDIGSVNYRWRDIYLSGGVQSAGGSTFTGATPMSFNKAGSGTYNKTVLYDSQNDTANNVFSGLTLEMGRLTDSSSATPRTFTISDRGASNRWCFSQYGLSFNPTNSVATAAESLDDYEEGTWTPVMHSSGGAVSASYSYRSAYYIKIGNSVFVRWGFRLSARSGGSGHAEVTGLPFTSKNYGGYQQPAAFVNAQGLTTDPDGPVLFYLVDNNTKIQGRLMNNADTGLPLSYFQNGSWCIGQFTYDVS